MDKTPRIEHGDQISAKSLPHVEHDAQEGYIKLERFREWHEGKRDGELVPATLIELWRAKQIMVDLKDKAFPVEIYDSLHLVNSWVNAHPSIFEDSTTNDQKEQLTKLFGQAKSDYNTHVKELRSDESAVKFKNSAEAYINHYFKIVDRGKQELTEFTDLSKYKPFSHLTFGEVKSYQTTPEALINRYKDDRETKVFIATSAYENGKQVICRYHREWLRNRLQRRIADVEAANWPTDDPDSFAHRMARERVPFDDPFHDVIQSLYGYTGGADAIRRHYTIYTLVDQIRKR